MSVDWLSFSPGSALAGGAIIGAAATLLALVNGRVAGISGIVGGLLHPSVPDTPWHFAFVAGLVAPIVYAAFGTLPELVIEGSYPVLVCAGVVTGIGTRYCSGCTSGHGVCGLSRFSLRSLVATFAFMLGSVQPTVAGETE